MAAATADRNTIISPAILTGATKAYPVNDGDTLYAGTMISLDSTGYASPAADTAGEKFIGVAKEYVDNASGSAGDVNVIVDFRNPFEITTSGAAITDVGRPVAVEFDNEVDLNNGNVWAGHIFSYNSSTSVVVKPGPVEIGYIDIPLLLASVQSGDVTTHTLLFDALIIKTEFLIHALVTTGGKSADLNLEIGDTDLTGGVLSLTTASLNTHAAVVTGAAITGDNWGRAGDVITVEATNTPNFAEGDGFLRIWYAKGA